MNDQLPHQDPPFSSITPEEKVMQPQATAGSDNANVDTGTSVMKSKLPFFLVGGVLVILVIFVLASQSMKKEMSSKSDLSGESAQSEQIQTSEEEIAAPPARVVTEVTVTAPVANSIVSSPLSIAGIVPPGWMFEGQLTVRLLDDQKNLIIEGPATEIYPGNWQTGEAVDFSGELTYTTTAESGFLVVTKPNPSGLAENDDNFSIPVKFQ